MDEPRRLLVYSVTKTWLGVLCLRLRFDLDASLRAWIDDDRLPNASLQQLLRHTSGRRSSSIQARRDASRSNRSRRQRTPSQVLVTL